MNVHLESFFDTLETLNRINSPRFSQLDLSEFFSTGLEPENLLRLEERFAGQLNFNIIYLLVTQEKIRKHYGMVLRGPEGGIPPSEVLEDPES